MKHYLYCFGYQTPNKLDTDFEDSQCIWILASSETESLNWGCEIAERFVADCWPDSLSWKSGNYAHWIETEDETALQ